MAREIEFSNKAVTFGDVLLAHQAGEGDLGAAFRLLCRRAVSEITPEDIMDIPMQDLEGVMKRLNEAITTAQQVAGLSALWKDGTDGA